MNAIFTFGLLAIVTVGFYIFAYSCWQALEG